jgi:hypothetical protein
VLPESRLRPTVSALSEHAAPKLDKSTRAKTLRAVFFIGGRRSVGIGEKSLVERKERENT